MRSIKDTVFRRVLQMPRRGVSQGTVTRALRTLEESALQNINDFDSQGIANTLHMIHKKRYYKPKENLFLVLEQRSTGLNESRMSVMFLKDWVTTSVTTECLSRMCLRLLT